MDIQSTTDKRTKRMLFWRMIISLFVFFGPISLILSPMYTSLISNSVYEYTLLPDIVYFIIQLLNLFAFAVCFSIIIYSIYKFQIASSAMLIVVYCAATFLKYTLNMAISSLMMRAFDVDEISGMMLSFVLDVIVAMIIVSAAHGVLKKYREGLLIEKKAAQALNKSLETKSDPFSFLHFYSANNPMQNLAARLGIIMALIKVISRLIYDLGTYGLVPMDTADLIWMIVYYTSDIVCGFIVYGISLITLKMLSETEKKFSK